MSDELKMIAQPLEFIPAEPYSGFLDRLRELLREYEVELILLGMPRNMDGSYGEASKDLLNLMHEIAAVGATRCWRDMGARDQLEGERILYTRLRRRLGITAVRARATASMSSFAVRMQGSS